MFGRKTKRANRYTEASDEGAGSTRFLQLRQVMLSSKEKANSTQTNEGLQHDQRLRKWGAEDEGRERGPLGQFRGLSRELHIKSLDLHDAMRGGPRRSQCKPIAVINPPPESTTSHHLQCVPPQFQHALSDVCQWRQALAPGNGLFYGDRGCHWSVVVRRFCLG